MRTITREEWMLEGKKLFGDNSYKWKFRCPKCGNVQSMQDLIKAGLFDADTRVYSSCIGRPSSCGVRIKCGWTLGGLFQLHKTEVLKENGEKTPVFEFANAEEIEKII